jgi:hypothetical protein
LASHNLQRGREDFLLDDRDTGPAAAPLHYSCQSFCTIPVPLQKASVNDLLCVFFLCKWCVHVHSFALGRARCGVWRVHVDAL